ncbi:hypothetical protein A0H81_01086 [Grifola frondosa]|uniref:Uncharacterized protein n=1 Tax=Grifola frondosa TaxID=5627 RepID=A0A1C7MT97_GRIFR|nr:hypothetical protein A0H81_01086 [Grifola frondosa]
MGVSIAQSLLDICKELLSLSRLVSTRHGAQSGWWAAASPGLTQPNTSHGIPCMAQVLASGTVLLANFERDE